MSGKTAVASEKKISATMISQLQLAPTSIPKSRPNRRLERTGTILRYPREAIVTLLADPPLPR